MSNEDVDNNSRRRFLTNATSVVGAVGTVFLAVPFISYWQPSAKALAAGAPVEADFSKLDPGKRLTVEWRGKPVWIIRRTEAMIADIKSQNETVLDPDSNENQQPEYCKNLLRSRKEEFFVGVGICTHLGCSPSFKPDVGDTSVGVEGWKGGFFCPCHGSKFDLAGRVFKGVPAPLNLPVPPHYYINDTTVLIGEDQKEAG